MTTAVFPARRPHTKNCSKLYLSSKRYRINTYQKKIENPYQLIQNNHLATVKSRKLLTW